MLGKYVNQMQSNRPIHISLKGGAWRRNRVDRRNFKDVEVAQKLGQYASLMLGGYKQDTIR